MDPRKYRVIDGRLVRVLYDRTFHVDQRRLGLAIIGGTLLWTEIDKVCACPSVTS